MASDEGRASAVAGQQAVLRRVLSVAIGAAVVAVLLSCSSAGSPVLAPAPSGAPTPWATSGGDGGCVMSRGKEQAGAGSAGLVTVDPAPRGATLVWLPGLNSTTCRAQMTTLDQPAASRLAQDLLAAPSVPSGRYNCPNDDRAGVTAYFRYADQPEAEVVDIHMSGCAFVGAPGRQVRRRTPNSANDLRTTAPPDWLSYLNGR